MLDLDAVDAIVKILKKLDLKSGEVITAHCLFGDHIQCTDIPECICKHHKPPEVKGETDGIHPYTKKSAKRGNPIGRVGRKAPLNPNAPSGDLLSGSDRSVQSPGPDNRGPGDSPPPL